MPTLSSLKNSVSDYIKVFDKTNLFLPATTVLKPSCNFIKEINVEFKNFVEQVFPNCTITQGKGRLMVGDMDFIQKAKAYIVQSLCQQKHILQNTHAELDPEIQQIIDHIFESIDQASAEYFDMYNTMKIYHRLEVHKYCFYDFSVSSNANQNYIDLRALLLIDYLNTFSNSMILRLLMNVAYYIEYVLYYGIRVRTVSEWDRMKHYYPKYIESCFTVTDNILVFKTYYGERNTIKEQILAEPWPVADTLVEPVPEPIVAEEPVPVVPDIPAQPVEQPIETLTQYLRRVADAN